MLQTVYKAYLIERNGTATDMRTAAYQLITASHTEFSSQEEAEIWLRDNGYMNTEYTVLPVYTRR